MSVFKSFKASTPDHQFSSVDDIAKRQEAGRAASAAGDGRSAAPSVAAGFEGRSAAPSNAGGYQGRQSVAAPPTQPEPARSASSSVAGAANPNDPAAAAQPLPEGWTFQTTPEGHVYYWHSVTGESRWVRPEPEPAAAADANPPLPPEPVALSAVQLQNNSRPSSAAHPYHTPEPARQTVSEPHRDVPQYQGGQAQAAPKQVELTQYNQNNNLPPLAAGAAANNNAQAAPVQVPPPAATPLQPVVAPVGVPFVIPPAAPPKPPPPPPPPTEWTGIQDWEWTKPEDRPCLLLLPAGKFYAFRQILLFLIIIYNCTIIPFRMAFGYGHVFDPTNEDSGQTQVTTGVGLLILLDWLTDAWQVVEIGLKFRTAYVSREGLMVYFRGDIEQNYLRGWFILDLLAVIPFDFIQLSDHKWRPWFRVLKSTPSHAARHTLGLMSCLVLVLQIARVYAVFESLDTSVAAGLHVLKLRTVRLFVIVFYLIHWVACLFYGLNEAEGFGATTWTLDPSFVVAYPYARSRYLYSVHWTIGVFSGVRVGSSSSVTGGGVFPVTSAELLFSLGVLAVGIVLLAYILEHIRFVAEVLSQRERRYRRGLQAMGQFLAHHELTEKLQREIFDYFQYWWVNTRGFRNEQQEVFSFLPTTSALRRNAKSSVTPNACGNVISQLPLFTRAGVGSDAINSPLVQDLCSHMTRVFAVKGEYVVRMDESVAAMFIIYKGESEVLLGLSERRVATLKPYTTFGEHTLCAPAGAAGMRLGALRCVSALSDYYVLTRADLDHVLTLYPDEAKVIAGVGNDAAFMKVAYDWQTENCKEDGKQVGLSMSTMNAYGDIKEVAPAAGSAEAAIQAQTGRHWRSGSILPPLTNTSSSAALTPPAAGAPEHKGEVDEKKSVVPLTKNRYTRSQRHIQHQKMNDDNLFADTGGCGCVLHPLSKHRRNWELVCMIIVLYQVVSIPYRMAFAPTSTNPGMVAAAAVCDIIFVLDIFFRLRLGYISDDGETITNPCYVCAHYLSGWFIFHVIAVFPLDWLILAQRGTLYTWLSCNRFLRIVDLFRSDRYTLSLVRNYTAVQLTELFGVTVLMIHFCACIFWSFTSFEAPGSSPFIPSVALAADSVSSQYLYSFYVACTHLLGHGTTLTPVTDEERGYAIWLMVGSLFLVPYLLGTIGALIGSLSAAESKWQEDTVSVLQYHDFHDAPSEVYARIRRYQTAVHQLEGGIHTNAIISSLPRGLRNDVLVELCAGVIRAVPLFRKANSRFLLRLIHCLTFESHAAAEVIIKAGQPGREACWIRRGFVEITTDDADYMKLRTVISTNPEHGLVKAIQPPAPAGVSLAITTSTKAGTAEQKITTDADGKAISTLTTATSAEAAAAIGTVPGSAPAPVHIDVKDNVAVSSNPNDPPGMVTIQVPIGSVTSVVAVAAPPPAPVPEPPAKPPSIHIIGRGDFFTGLPPFTGTRMNKFTATAKSGVQLLVLNWSDFAAIIKDFPDVRADMETLKQQRGTLAFG